MTTVTFYRNNNKYTGFTCFGHAEYAKKHLFRTEPDILCSAISALVMHTINAMSELAKEELDVKTNEETGFIDCRFDDIQEKSLFLVDALAFSLKNISEEYGENYLQVKFEEV